MLSRTYTLKLGRVPKFFTGPRRILLTSIADTTYGRCMVLLTLTCAATDCEESFTQVREHQMYHSATCALRMRARRRRAKLKAHPPNLPPSKPPTRTIAARVERRAVKRMPLVEAAEQGSGDSAKGRKAA